LAPCTEFLQTPRRSFENKGGNASVRVPNNITQSKDAEYEALTQNPQASSSKRRGVGGEFAPRQNAARSAGDCGLRTVDCGLRAKWDRDRGRLGGVRDGNVNVLIG